MNTYPSNIDYGMASSNTGISGISCTGQEKKLTYCDWTRNATVSLPCVYVSVICSGEWSARLINLQLFNDIFF